MKDKLKKIVEKMMEGGFNPYAKSSIKGLDVNRYDVDSFDYGILFYAYERPINEEPAHYSYPDLITSPAAMRAVFSSDDMCTRPKEGGCCHGDPGTANCSLCSLNQDAYVYHGLKAAELLLTQGQQQSIEYIWKECGE